MQIYIGYDERETIQYLVAKASAHMTTVRPIPTRPIWLRKLQEDGRYMRPVFRAAGRLFDGISQHPMATKFAIARFFTPLLAREYRACGNLAAFVDCDVMFRQSPVQLFEAHKRGCAVSVVKHNHIPKSTVKMDKQLQGVYPRKNWSSVMVFDLDHPKIKLLSESYLNKATGLDLHGFAWLEDDEIGALPPEWNCLVGYSEIPDPALVHWTEGAPCMAGYEDAPYADEFWNVFSTVL